MSKQVLLRIIDGNFEQGFCYCLDISEVGKAAYFSSTGKLPANLNLLTDYQEWQKAYYSHDTIVRSGLRNHRITIPDNQKNNVSEATESVTPPDYFKITKNFRENMTIWLDSKEFQLLKEHILESITKDESSQLIISTDIADLQKLPWQVWSLCNSRPHLEITFSSANFSIT